MNNGWWTIPSEKAKNNLSHRVPLSSLALQLLDQVKLLSGNSRWLFPSRQGDKRVLDTSIDHALHKNEAKFGIPPFTPHDLRRTAASHMTGKIGFSFAGCAIKHSLIVLFVSPLIQKCLTK